MKSLKQCHSIADLRLRAKGRLPKPIFDYLDGGSDDEISLRRNSSAFDDYELLPRYLNDVQQIDLGTRVLGLDIQLPFFLSPTGTSRLFHHHKELGVARAAAEAGTLYNFVEYVLDEYRGSGRMH
ncbi:L-lactate dehydrogenase (cytochrome) [Luminiphilus syltensis NOR5-1B]|uniref:L-lactate dehydrogenase (Cytochrome) n=1 Tax=Luminiphilus syltensis NOR5-1B TaxID=565045 RepID=B8KT52_9GAMM|nr:alpha-hydroxy-acid oxidizing protein [Luminiphilus syltensis]EED36214.1 L-lactate dehydrogenase (cytochrome) [Luminiphilus syltensis NOR5-1B]